MNVPATLRSSTRLAGPACLWGGLIGAGQAAVLLLVPASVGADRYSYPFGVTGYTLAQLTFFLQHLPLCLGLVGLLALPAVQQSRSARVGARIALVGMAALALMELVAVSAARTSVDSTLASTINTLYGPPTLLIGAGLLLAGRVVLGQGAGWRRVVPLATGSYVFLVLLPTLMGSYTAARLGIGGWMLLFAALGASLTPPAGAQWGTSLLSPSTSRT